MEEGEIGRVKKSDDADIVVRVSEFRERKGVDIREFVDSETYSGPTKKGIWIKEENWADLKKVLDKVKL